VAKYGLVYTQRAARDLSRLDPPVRKRLGKALERYAEDPLKHAKKLVDPLLGSYRFRVGDYRVVFDIVDDELVILRIGHRSDIYRG